MLDNLPKQFSNFLFKNYWWLPNCPLPSAPASLKPCCCLLALAICGTERLCEASLRAQKLKVNGGFHEWWYPSTPKVGLSHGKFWMIWGYPILGNPILGNLEVSDVYWCRLAGNISQNRAHKKKGTVPSYTSCAIDSNPPQDIDGVSSQNHHVPRHSDIPDLPGKLRNRVLPHEIWLVVDLCWPTPLKNIGQLGWLFPIYGKITRNLILFPFSKHFWRVQRPPKFGPIPTWNFLARRGSWLADGTHIDPGR